MTIERVQGLCLSHLYPHKRSLFSHVGKYIIMILLLKVKN